LAYILMFLSIFGLITSAVFTGMTLVATSKFLVARRHRRSLGFGYTPPVSVLKPLHGSPAHLEECLEGYFHLDYPEYELIFCARHADDAGLAIARKLADRYPHIPVTILNSGEPPWINARCYSMALMAHAARHELLVASDADVPARPEYLREMVAPFQQAKVGASTCIYRGDPIDGGFGEQLESLGMSVEMTSGVLVADMLEGVRFTLGPSIAVRKTSLERIGGFARLGIYAADDYMLGFLIAEAGETVVISDHVIDHLILRSGLRKSLEHQLSWMRSTRFSRPKGHFGTVLTFAVPFGILAWIAGILIHRPCLGVGLFLFTILTKMVQSIVVGGMVVHSKRAMWLSFLYPLRDLVGFFLWLASYSSNRLQWHGRVFELEPGGTIHLPGEEPHAQKKS